MNILLYEPQDLKNMAIMARTLEIFGVTECWVYDTYNLVQDFYPRHTYKILNRLSKGAIFKIQFKKIQEPLVQFFQQQEGRKIAFHLTDNAQSLYTFQFEKTDILVFGNEQYGLPAEVVEHCTTCVQIPQKGNTQSLNLNVTLGIVLYELGRT